jgi:hypothetical protein
MKGSPLPNLPPPFPTCIFIITLLGYKINSENMTLVQILLSYTSNNLENGAEKMRKEHIDVILRKQKRN